MVEFKKSF